MEQKLGTSSILRTNVRLGPRRIRKRSVCSAGGVQIHLTNRSDEMRSKLSNLFFAILSIAAFTLAFGATPMFEKTAELEADQWEFFVSNTGSGCEACCPGGLSLCCDVPANCDATSPREDPAG